MDSKAVIRVSQDGGAGIDNRDIVGDALLSPPAQNVRHQLGDGYQGSNTTYLCKILPNLFLLVAFSLPLFADDLRNLRICESRIAGDDGMLVVLAIKNKCYKESAAEQYVRKQRHASLFPSHSSRSGISGMRGIGDKDVIGLTVPRTGNLGFRLAEADAP